MAVSKLLSFAIFMSCSELVLPLSPRLPSFESYRQLRDKAHHSLLTPRNDAGFLWSDLFVEKLRQVVAATRTAEVLQGLQDPVCMDHLVHIASQLDDWITNGTLPDTFVLQLIDAWGKLSSGILRGHLTDPGDFEECIHAKGYLNSSLFPREAKGAYSMSLAWITPEAAGGREFPGPFPNRTSSTTAVSPDKLMSYMFTDHGAFMLMLPMIGTCFPNTCSQTDAQQFVNNVMGATFGDQVYLGLFPRIIAEKPSLDAGAICFIAAVVVLLCVCLIGTVVDLITLNSKGQQSNKTVASEALPASLKVLKCFSLYTNTLNFLNARPKDESWMICLNGMKFLSFAWIVLAHSWGFLNYQTTWNAIDLRESIRSGWGMMFILNASVAFDSLFVISGCIVGYTMLGKLEKDKKLNPLPLYCWKYVRNTLPVLLIAAFSATVLPYMGNGPYWYVIDAESSSCASNWWHNILHVNTLVHYDVADPQKFMCHANSWYVADEMIYFLVAPIFVYVLWRWRNVGLGLLLLWMLQPVIYTGVLIAVEDLMPTYIPSLPGPAINTYIFDLYVKPWTRSTPYAVGLLLGYLLYHYRGTQNEYKSPPYSPPGLIVSFGWMASTGIALAVLLSPVRFFDVANADETQGSLGSILYGSLHRLLWSIAIAWAIFAVVNEYPRWMNRLLSWQPLVSLGKLSLCMYLCAQYVQWVHRLSKYEPVRYNASNLAEGALFHLLLSVLAGFLLYVTLQAPVERLHGFIGQKQPPRSKISVGELDIRFSRRSVRLKRLSDVKLEQSQVKFEDFFRPI